MGICLGCGVDLRAISGAVFIWFGSPGLRPSRFSRSFFPGFFDFAPAGHALGRPGSFSYESTLFVAVPFDLSLTGPGYSMSPTGCRDAFHS